MRQVMTLICLIFFGACISNDPEFAPSQFDRDFFNLTTNEQIKQFSKYGIETQYELLVVGNQVVHPPALYLIEEFARKGETVIPFLHTKLNQAKRDVAVRDIVAILSEMQRLRTYDVQGDASLMALAENRIAAMQGKWKLVTQHMIEEIRRPMPKDVKSGKVESKARG